MRRMMILAAVLALVIASPVVAGEKHGVAGEKHGGDPMAAMANCHVCKVMMPHMGELMPTMETKVISMDNGMAMMTTITDAAKVGLYHKTCDAMHTAGAETLEFTAEDAKVKMCPMCYKMWDIMAAGGHMSSGKTDNGHLMVLSSDDENVQKKIAALQKEYETMMAGS